MTDFTEKLVLLAMDKLVLALIVAAAGLWINRTFERFRSETALRGEVAKTTIAKMNDVWALSYAWEVAVQRLIDGVREVRTKAGDDEIAFKSLVLSTIIPLETEANLKAEAAGTKIEKERFWFTERQYREFLRYQEALKDLVGAYIDGDQLQRDEARLRWEQARPNAHRLANLS